MEQKIRIVTWNCRLGQFTKKDPIIDCYHPDIAIIQEIRTPKKDDDNHCIWVRNTLTKDLGVAILSSKDFAIKKSPINPELPEVFVPIEVRGKANFNLLAVWTQKKWDYIESFQQILETYSTFLRSAPSVIAGDFNSNSIWDKKHERFSHSRVVEKLLQDFGLASVYHKKTGDTHGNENAMTFFRKNGNGSSYHLDYCFIPQEWEIMNVEMGSLENWVIKKTDKDRSKSDHLPLIVDVVLK